MARESSRPAPPYGGENLKMKLLIEFNGLSMCRRTFGNTRWSDVPGTTGGPKHHATLAGQITSAIRRQIGLVVNPHLFRHLAAKLYLDAHPGEYALVARLLGHKSVQTTMDFYAAFDNAAAARHYHNEILQPCRNDRRSS